ncbi:MAG: hypothetical protein AAFX07_00505 [Pseudomonadota bacterium]
MKQHVAETAIETGKDWMWVVLAGLGVSTMEAIDFFGGMLLSIAAGLLAWRLFPEADRRKFWVVVVTAFFAGWVGAFLTERFLPDVPVQFGMAAFGFSSKVIANILFRLVGRVEQRTDNIADTLVDRVLGDEDKKK